MLIISLFLFFLKPADALKKKLSKQGSFEKSKEIGSSTDLEKPVEPEKRKENVMRQKRMQAVDVFDTIFSKQVRFWMLLLSFFFFWV